MRESLCRETEKEKTFKETKKNMIILFILDRTKLLRVPLLIGLPSLHGGLLEIALTVPMWERTIC